MKLALLGATGRTGRHVVQQATAAGHELAVLVRDPAKAGPGPRVVTGVVQDAAAVRDVVGGADAVLVALGPAPGAPPPTQTEGLRHVVAAMTETGARRVVVVSGAGADAPGDRKRLLDRVASALVHLVNREDVREKERQLALLADSGLDWTVLRPPVLTDGPSTGAELTMLSPGFAKVPRADLAALLLQEALSPHYLRQAPFVAPLPRHR